MQRSNIGNLRTICCPSAGPTGTTGSIGPTGPTGPAGDQNVIFVRSAPVDYTELATGGNKILFTAESGTASYSIINCFLVAVGSVQWSGGNRSALISGGTTPIGTINSSTLTTLATTSYSLISPANDTFGINLPNTDPVEPTTPGADIIIAYTGGTTDYTAGSGLISLILYRVTA